MHGLLPLAVLALFIQSAAMFFTTDPSHPTWDTWSFYETGLEYGPFFEYYLAFCPGVGTWCGFGVATSSDGVHWSDQGVVLTRDANATGGYLGTGSVWRAPPGANYSYIVNFSQQYGSPNEQHIFFATSNDLVTWTKLGWEHVFPVNASAGYTSGRWDCIWALDDPSQPPNSGFKLGFWTATPLNRAGFGLGASQDGGVTWTALPAPLLLGNPHSGGVEIGAVERLPGGQGRYFAMVGSAGQMLTFTADTPSGPFTLASVNPTLLGFSPGSRATTYFSRFFPTAPGPLVLVTHQWISRLPSPAGARCFLPPLKTALVDALGVLRLGWWEGNEAVRGVALPLVPAWDPPRMGSVALWQGLFNITSGVIVELRVNLTSLAAYAGSPAGLFVETLNGSGVAIAVLSPRGEVGAGPCAMDGSGFVPEERWDRALNLSSSPTPVLRVLLRLGMVEAYLEGVLMTTFATGTPAFPSGRLGTLDAAGDTEAPLVVSAGAWGMTLPGSGLAYQAPALASSSYQPGGAQFEAARAVDGDPSTRWSSGLPYASNSTAWLRVDLGSPQNVSSVTIYWQESVAFASRYTLQCALAASGGGGQPGPWQQLFSTDRGQGGMERVAFPPQVCHYVLLNCTRTGPQNGYSVYELEVR
jgi:hypothetical protein